MKNYYQILEIDPSATIEQIKSQHRLLIHAWHPDKFPEGDLKRRSHEKIIEINEAFEILSNPTKRRAYDSNYQENVGGLNNRSNNNNQNSDSNNPPVRQPSKKNKQQKFSFVKVSIFLFLGGLSIASLMFFVGLFLFRQQIINQVSPNPSPNNQSIIQPTIFPPTNTPSPKSSIISIVSPQAPKSIEKECFQWEEVNRNWFGKTICAYGEIVNFSPVQEVRVPEIGMEWRWYYFFSDNRDIFLSHYSADFDFEFFGGCIEITGELHPFKTRGWFIEILPNNWVLSNKC